MQKLVQRYMTVLTLLVPASLFSVASVAATAELVQQNNRLKVSTDNGKLQVSASEGKQLKILLQSIKFNYQSAKKWDISTADQNSIQLTGHFAPSAEFYRTVYDNDQRLVNLTISKVSGGFRLHASPKWGRQVTLELKDLDDHIFGLTEGLQPDNRLSPDLRNSVIQVDVNAEEASIHENFASAHSAFFISSLGYGSFFDTFARGTYSIAINGVHRIHHDGGELDWYLFFGDSGAQIHQAYFDLIGDPKSVPAWGLGPIGWRDQNDGGAAEVLDDIEKMNQLEIPFTSWFIDRPYSDGTHGWSEMNFSPIFAEPGKWISKIRHDYGLEFMTWTTPAFFGATPFAKHLLGSFSYIDLTDKNTVDAFKQTLVDKQLQYGVKGHKIDRADEGFPVYEKWQDESVLPAYRRNQYAYLMAKVHDEALRSVWGDDQITFVRSAIHRSQPYVSAIWAGDPRTTWEGLQSNFANAARSAFMGFPVWGTDVGGYQGDGYIPEDLYLRWLQAGSMSGLFEIKLDGAGGDGKDRMPWQYSEKVQNQFRAILDDRMQLVPYLYSLAQTSGDNGTLMQPLAYRHLDDSNTYSVWDEFYVGDGILVAPVFEPGEHRSVYLPQGQWRDFDDASVRFEGGKTIKVDAPLSKLPRFVQANSVFVTGNLYAGNSKLWQQQPKQLIIHAFPGEKDSQKAFTYVDMLDKDQHKIIKLERSAKQIIVSSPAMSYLRQFEVVLDAKPHKVQINGTEVDFAYDAQSKLLKVKSALQSDISLAISL
ncbi:TIM-barrel domain-containing protein [Neptunicella sp.]|uniref:TIM-barrel domain-containing protein n=1 Tax=Neptunicella sp. TaxID=2125986 RepID=UPI003F68D91D